MRGPTSMLRRISTPAGHRVVGRSQHTCLAQQALCSPLRHPISPLKSLGLVLADKQAMAKDSVPAMAARWLGAARRRAKADGMAFTTH